MPAAKPLSKEMILAAMAKTKSNRACARYLNVSYHHYKKWAKQYKVEDGKEETLFDKQLNPMGKGIPKFLNNKGKLPAILDLIEGRADPSSFSPEKIKLKLINEGYLDEKCANCGFCERRVNDYRMPLLMHFKDGNKQNYRKENLDLLCYNCYYLTVGIVFTDDEVRNIEDHRTVYRGEVDWELDPYQKEMLEKIGSHHSEEPNDLDKKYGGGSEFIDIG
jgi:hypothetical protein